MAQTFLVPYLFPNSNSNHINVKLTDTGRRLLSEGKLTYKRVVYSDREIDYNIDRSGIYDIANNRVMSPKDDQPGLPPTSFNGTPAIDISSQLFSGTFISTADCFTRGFYVNNFVGNVVPTVHDYILNQSLALGFAVTDGLNFDGTNTVPVTSSYSPPDGCLAMVIFTNPSGAGNTLYTSNDPYITSWYRVTGSTTSITADREFPDFSSAGAADNCLVIYYPWNGIRAYYGSANTVDTQVWNLNIVRTSSEIGTELGMSGYTTYGSIDYNGQKHYFGFDNHYRQVGFIHYTNEFTGNTYQEQFVPGSTEVDLPHVLWHRHASNAGEGERAGHRFLDRGSDVYFDSVAQTTYTLLKDDVASDAFTVGRVYPKLKLIVITDPELLTALSYKSNRNYTLPPLTLSQRSTPRAGFSINDVEGCLKEDKTWYVTYGVSSTNTWIADESFGYQPVLHCGYIQKITGTTDSDGYSPYLSATFSSQAFPYLRSDVGMTTYSGTGWNANAMNILFKEVDTDDDTGVDNVGSDGWKIVNSGAGYYTGGEDGADTINPIYALSYEFIVDQADVTSATTYVLHSAFTDMIDYRSSGETLGMTLGNEAFFFGNIKVSTMKTWYKTVISLQAADGEFNESDNSTFDPDQDDSTYITEIGVLDDENRLVAIGKLTKPLEKNDSIFLTLQLEMDF